MFEVLFFGLMDLAVQNYVCDAALLYLLMQVLHMPLYRVAQNNAATLSHCKYSENSMIELRGNW